MHVPDSRNDSKRPLPLLSETNGAKHPFEITSQNPHHNSLLHAVAWVQVQKGGAVMFTFADFPHSPSAFREGQRPPRVPPRWQWEPGRVVPERDLSWYDYVLVHDGPGARARAISSE
jgi:hypothetical protein